MTAGEALLDAFLNANILFAICFALWLVVRMGMHHLGLKHAFETQLKLLKVIFLAIACAPFIAAAYRSIQSAGMARDMNINLSDAVVAYYLNGGFQMDASRFEALVLMRDTFVLRVLNADGLIAQAAILIFLAGLTVGLVRLVLSVSCLSRIVKASYAWRDFGRIKLRLSDRTLVPFSTRGFRNYYVVIPSHMLSESAELKVAIAHELQHIRQGDLEWEIVLEALKPVFFLNPAYHAWKRQVEHLRELNCDHQVLLNGRIDVRSYCETLVSVCQRTLRRDRAFVLAVPKVTLVTADRSPLVITKRSFLEHRIHSALTSRRTRFQHLVFAAVSVPLLIATTLTTLAIQSPGDWSHDRLMLSTVVNLDRLNEINRLSAFGQLRE
ncbi:MAG: M56 family metallopeptidase [Pseudomonadota bacterium]